MPSYKTAFKSNYVRSEDLPAQGIVATIANAGMELVGTGAEASEKLVIHFEGDSPKALVCNLTNADSIAEIAGTDDYDAWPGVRIRLYPTKTTYQGRRVACIRIDAPPAAKTSGRPNQQAKTSAPVVAGDDSSNAY